MKVISLKIAERAVDTATGEIWCLERYSRLSTLDPSISKRINVYKGRGVHSMTRMRFLAHIMSGIFNNEPGMAAK